MKVFKRNLVLIVLIALSVSSVFAQFSSVKNNKIGFSSSNEIESSYGRIYAGYNKWSLKYSDFDVSEDFKGVDLGVLFAKNIAKCNLPLYLEYGLEASWNKFSAYDYYVEETAKYNFMSLSVPVNIAYKLYISDTDIAISPYIGLNAKYHVLGKVKWDGETEDFFEDGEDVNRFQLGLNMGLGISFNRIYLGYRYQSDIMPFIEVSDDDFNYKVKTHSNMITIGYNF